MTRAVRENQMWGTETKGFRIWVINIQYRTVNAPMALKPINPKVVAEIITWVLRSIEDKLVCVECCLWGEGAQSESVKGETVKWEMASPRGGLGKTWELTHCLGLEPRYCWLPKTLEMFQAEEKDSPRPKKILCGVYGCMQSRTWRSYRSYHWTIKGA